MATRVTMRMFASRPNPTYVLSSTEEARLHARIGGLPVPPGVAPTYRVGGLGLRGYLLEPIPAPRPVRSPVVAPPAFSGPVSVYGGIVDYFGQEAARLDAGRALESWLLGVMLPGLDGDLQVLARKESRDLYDDPDCRAGNRGNSVPPLPGRPAYAPAPWNAAATSFRNNCYNYANARRFTTGTPAVPGMGGGEPTPFGPCSKITRAVKKDLLKRMTKSTTAQLPGGGWLVALFVKPGGLDHHFYRQDRTGKWSHKPGAWPARNCDEGGAAIVDPLTADTLDYVFCGFFETNGGALIQG